MTFGEWFSANYDDHATRETPDREFAKAIWNAAVEASAQAIDDAAKWYGAPMFRSVPNELKAKDGIAADLLHEMYPRLAKSIREDLKS